MARAGGDWGVGGGFGVSGFGCSGFRGLRFRGLWVSGFGILGFWGLGAWGLGFSIAFSIGVLEAERGFQSLGLGVPQFQGLGSKFRVRCFRV